MTNPDTPVIHEITIDGLGKRYAAPHLISDDDRADGWAPTVTLFETRQAAELFLASLPEATR